MAPDIFPPKTFEEMDDSEKQLRSGYDRRTFEEWWEEEKRHSSRSQCSQYRHQGSFTARTG